MGGESHPVLSGEGRHVLVVEDDGELRPLLLSLLRRSGFRATGARNGVEMRAALEGGPVDLVLLDVMLPGRSGFELCREIRAEGPLPVILLTALAEASDLVVGLELGADDYIVKPPDPRELVARIRAVLRRRDQPSGGGFGGPRVRARFGGWTLDTQRRELSAPDGRRVELTSGEYDLLLAFVEHPQRVLSREQLLDWGRGRSFGLGRSIDAQVSRLRAKLGDASEAEGLLKTIRGAGYMLARDVGWG